MQLFFPNIKKKNAENWKKNKLSLSKYTDEAISDVGTSSAECNFWTKSTIQKSRFRPKINITLIQINFLLLWNLKKINSLHLLNGLLKSSKCILETPRLIKLYLHGYMH